MKALLYLILVIFSASAHAGTSYTAYGQPAVRMIETLKLLRVPLEETGKTYIYRHGPVECTATDQKEASLRQEDFLVQSNHRCTEPAAVDPVMAKLLVDSIQGIGMDGKRTNNSLHFSPRAIRCVIFKGANASLPNNMDRRFRCYMR